MRKAVHETIQSVFYKCHKKVCSDLSDHRFKFRLLSETHNCVFQTWLGAMVMNERLPHSYRGNWNSFKYSP